MDPTLQIDAERCVLVLGSQLAAAALALSEGVPAALSYAMVVEIGMQKMLELDGIEKLEERARKQSLMLNAYELEPSFAASKVVDSLREHGIYKKWLEELFGSLLSLPVQRHQVAVVETLRSLQEKGVLLVYTYYDTILDAALKTSPVFLNDEAAVRSWASRQTPGLLHVHGVYTHPDSVRCDCVDYRQLVGESCGAPLLREVCRNRNVVFLGFDGEFFDPFLFKFSRAFLSPSQPPPLLLSLAPKLPSLDIFLTLKIPQLSNLDRVFISSAPVPRLGAGDCVASKISTTLLYSNKTSCKEAAERVKVTAGINVHQLTMRHEHVYHQLQLYLDPEGLRALWKQLFMAALQEGASLCGGFHLGLLGVVLDRTVVWLNRAAALGKASMSLPSPMEMAQGLHNATPLSGHAPSLSTNVSVISSMWAPIASPSASRPVSSAHTRLPSLLSPLISSTSRTSLGGVATKSPQLAVVNTLSPHHLHAHTQVRRVQSEQDHLTYQDCLAKHARRNGLLIHTESAPNFDGGAPPGARVGGTERKVSNQAYPFLRDGSQPEVKVECVDQSPTHHPDRSLVHPDRSPAHCPNMRSLSAELRLSVPALSPKGFAEERQKFISEAQSWSRHVDSELAKKRREEEGPGSRASGDAGLSLGLFNSRVGGGASGQPSLSSKFSLEEQEKLLRQHFLFQREQLQLSGSAHHQNSVTPPQHISVTSHTLSAHAHAPPKISPHHHESSHSPSKSPLNPYQATPTSIFPFLNQAASPAANFMCNPSMSQYSAALLNPLYQVAMQQLLASQLKGAPLGKPVLASDPSIMQSLVEKVPIFLPDGSITFIPTSSLERGGARENSTLGGLPERSPADDGGSGHKRIRSPDAEAWADMRGSPPKRRRSSSLPDITQVPMVPLATSSLKEGIKEEESVAVLPLRMIPARPPEESRPRSLAPPTMIHIPQDIKLGDPLMRFPTPPPQQSSPLVGNFALSPIVLSSGFHQQPMTPVTPGQEGFGAEELRELVEARGAQTPLPPSPEGSNLPPFPAGRGPIQLWQFLLDLLLSPDKRHMIDWTGKGYEFRILQPEEIAKLWGARKNKPRMNYDKLSRGLRYYYSKGIMDKVQGKKLTFKYTCNVQNYVRSLQSQNATSRQGGGAKYRTGSESTMLPVPPGGPNEDFQEAESVMPVVENGGGAGAKDMGQRSLSDMELVATGFHSAEGISGMMGVVSQGFVNSLQGGSQMSENDKNASLAHVAVGAGVCSQGL